MKKLLLCLLASSQFICAQTATDAIHHLQNQKFENALEILTDDLDQLSDEEFTADLLLLLKARAFNYSNQPQKVIESIKQFIEKYPDSKWIAKANFLKAEALVNLKKHNEASVIYQSSAQQLFSPASKNAGAEILIKIAEEFSKEITPEGNSEDNKIDLVKADALLKEAYETDCSNALKEQILTKRIKINTRSKRWKNVISLSFLYLEEFDSTWQGELDSLERLTNSSVTPNKKDNAGKNRFLVRFHLAEALHRNNDRITASRYLKELITDLRELDDANQKGLLADAVWLNLMASRNNGGHPRDINLWMTDVQDYLKNYPNHIHASATAYSIGVIYQNDKQHDLAIQAFQDFLDNKYQIEISPNPLTSRPENTLEFSQRQKQTNANKENASYRIGEVYLSNKQFDKAQQAWNETSKAYPNGARWADCQRGLVDIHYQRSIHTVTTIASSETLEAKEQARQNAQKALNDFIVKHPLDNRVPSLLFLTGNIHYIQSTEIENSIKESEVSEEIQQLKNKQSQVLKDAIESWELLITKYPSSPYANDAQYLTAKIYENSIGDLDKAYSIYKKSSHPDAHKRVTALTSKKLIASSNKNFTTAEQPFVELSTRNIESVTVRQYWLDVESYFRKGRKLNNISSLDVDLVEADKTWEHKLPNYKKRHLLENKINIPFPENKPGICIIKIESKDYSTTTMVMRSDIDLAVRSSDSEIIAYAYDARTEKPSAGVKLLIADAGKVVATGTTTEQGYFHLKDKKLDDISDLRILGLSQKGIATCNNNDQDIFLPTIDGSITPNLNQAKAFFNLSKAIYQAGETLPISGIIRHKKDGVFIFPNKDQRKYTLSIRNDQKLLYTAPLSINKRGLFSHQYEIPEYLPNWSTLNISLSPDFDEKIPDFIHKVTISQKSESLLNLKLNINKLWIKKGESITGTISATYRWGAPYSHQKLELSLPNYEKLEVITDNDGNAEFTYSPQLITSGKTLEFKVSTLDKKHLSPPAQVLYNPVPFSILAASEHLSMLSGSTSNIEIKTLSPDGKPVSKALNLEVIETQKIDADPILTSTRDMENASHAIYSKVVLKTIPLITDPETGKIIYPLKLEKAGIYQLKVTPQETSKLERSAFSSSSIRVFDTNKPESIIIQASTKTDAKVGETVTLNTWSSLGNTVPALLTVETETIIKKRIIQLQPGKNTVTLDLTTKHCPVFSVNILALNNRKILSADQTFSVVNPLTIKSTILDVISRANGKNAIKLKLQAFDSNDTPTPADFFINLSKNKQFYPESFTKTFNGSELLYFNSFSSTGLSHKGTQEAINTEVRDELRRLSQAENDSIRRYEQDPILAQENIGSSSDFEGAGIYLSQTGNHYSGFTVYNKFHSTNAAIVKTPDLATQTSNHRIISTLTRRIPKEGKEITILTDHIKTSDYHLQIVGFSNSNANGVITNKIPVPVQKIAEKKSKNGIQGIPVSEQVNMMFNAGVNSTKFTLPEGATVADLKLAIATSPSELLANAVNNALSSEFGSTTPFHAEHPAGQLMAHVAYLDYLTHHKLDELLREKLRIRINTLCSNLTISQKSNGSWSAVRHRKMNSLLHTAMAYQALVAAKAHAIEIEPTTIEKAKDWLNDQKSTIDTDFYSSRALVQYALASSGDADFATCNRLFRERQKMDNIGKAILANTFILLDRKEFTTTLLKEIGKEAKVKKHEELPLSSQTLLEALSFEARNAIKEPTELNSTFTLLYHSDIDRGTSVRAYVSFLKRQKSDENKVELTVTINGNEIEGKILPKHLKNGENTIQVNSSKPVYLSAILSGYEPAKETNPEEKFVIQDRKYYQDNLLYKGVPLKSSGTSETNTLQVGETVKVVLKGSISNKKHAHSIIVEEIPAGFTYLSGSLRGNHSGARKEGNHLVITYNSVPDKYKLSYTLVAGEVGTWHHRPTLLSPTYDLSQLTYNAAKELTISSPDNNKSTPYQTNAAEHYELAQLYFNDKKYTEAKQHIIQYNKLKQSSEDPQLAKMLLWIEADNPTPDAQLLADSFEVLTERAPELVIPFEKILKVGNAYRTIGEHERSTDVFTATLEANFTSESYISAVLEDQGKFLLSLDYQDKLWLQYPDLGEISTSRFELAQQLYTIATEKEKLAKLGINPETKKAYTEKELTTLSLDYMQSFLTHSPTHEFAADASFSIANALFALKRYQEVIDQTVNAAVTHKDSTHATSFRYMQAVGHYWLRNYDKALKAASKVAQENSDDKDLAAFITAQIYHAKGQPEQAMEWYENIKDKYPDAKQSIAYFEQKSISIDEVKVLNSGDKATLKVKFRNIKEAQFQIYRVDLMKLYLREKNLSNISKINLAGISPKHSLTIQLGDGKDFKEMEKDIELPISKDGAYLVICRGDYLYTSALTLITPLKMEVQEDQDMSSVRVNISDKKSSKYLDSVHIKAVGVNKDKIVSGDTDLRGVWQGEEVQSPSTIIAKDKEGRYAFFRSKLAKRAITPQKMNGIPNLQIKEKVDFNKNLKLKQETMNQSNSFKYESKRRSKGKGVEIQKARKK